MCNVHKAKYNSELFFLGLEKNEYSLYLTHAKQVAQKKDKIEHMLIFELDLKLMIMVIILVAQYKP